MVEIGRCSRNILETLYLLVTAIFRSDERLMFLSDGVLPRATKSGRKLVTMECNLAASTAKCVTRTSQAVIPQAPPESKRHLRSADNVQVWEFPNERDGKGYLRPHCHRLDGGGRR